MVQQVHGQLQLPYLNPAPSTSSSFLSYRPSQLPNIHLTMGGGSHPTMASASTYPRMAAKPVGKQIHNLYTDRLRQFTDNGQYRNQGLLPYAPSPDRLCHTHMLIYA